MITTIINDNIIVLHKMYIVMNEKSENNIVIIQIFTILLLNINIFIVN